MRADVARLILRIVDELVGDAVTLSSSCSARRRRLRAMAART